MLLEHCKPLKDYMTLIDYIRDYQAEGMSLQAAVNQAIDRCIEDVMRMFFAKDSRGGAEYDFDRI